jgi:hypothetical protein
MRMPPRPIPLLVLPILLSGALSGCGPDKDEFAPPCPRPTLVRGLEDMTRFRPNGGKDLTDMTIQGRVTRLDGECRFTEKKGTTVEATVTVTAEFTRGPALQSRDATVPVFIAVAEGGTVLDKRVIEFPVEFPGNVDKASLTSQPVHMILPTTRDKSPAAFSIVAGFQLTPDERETNRERGTAR